MKTQSTSRLQKISWPFFAVAGTPAIVFYFLLFKSVGNYPIVDDYHAVLEFVNIYSQLDSIQSKIFHVLNFQHNEYKLVFENIIFIAQHEFFGGINFAALSMLGNAFVLALFVLILSTFKNSTLSNSMRIATALPVGFLIFQLQYASTLNFSMAGLQNIPVLVFSLLAIILLAKNRRSSLIGACAATTLAVMASGSGFLLAVVGGLLLIEQKRWKDTVLWGCLFVGLALFYFTNYNPHATQASPDGSVTESAKHLSIPYMLAFMGSSIARYQGYLPSIAAGIVIFSIWVFAAKCGYSKKNPAVFYFVIFLVLTAAGVSAIRSNLGLEQSLASRYRIYSNLLLVLSYIFLSEKYLIPGITSKAKIIATGLIIILSVGFFAFSNAAGFRFLQGRNQAVAIEMRNWKSSNLNDKATNFSSEQNFDPAVSRQLSIGLYKPATTTLLESIKLGVYFPK